jgi:hypothetical protein
MLKRVLLAQDGLATKEHKRPRKGSPAPSFVCNELVLLAQNRFATNYTDLHGLILLAQNGLANNFRDGTNKLRGNDSPYGGWVSRKGEIQKKACCS